MTQIVPWTEYNSHGDTRYAELLRGCRAWLARPDCNRIIVSTSMSILSAPIGWHLYKKLIADLPIARGCIIPGLKLNTDDDSDMELRWAWLLTTATIDYLRVPNTPFILEAEGFVRDWIRMGLPASKLRALLEDVDFTPGGIWWWPGVAGETHGEMLKRLDLCSAIEHVFSPKFICQRWYRPASVNNGHAQQQAQMMDNVTTNQIQNLYFNGVLGDGWPDDQLQAALGVAGNPAEVIIYPGSARFASSAEMIR